MSPGRIDAAELTTYDVVRWARLATPRRLLAPCTLFDLKSGASKGRYPYPTDKGICNDIAVGMTARHTPLTPTI
jgi:hypothetical protein